MWLKIISRWLENTVHVWWLPCFLRVKAGALYYSSMADHAEVKSFFEKNTGRIATHPNAAACCQMSAAGHGPAVTNCALDYNKCFRCARHQKSHKKAPRAMHTQREQLVTRKKPMCLTWSRSIFWACQRALVLAFFMPPCLQKLSV